MTEETNVKVKKMEEAEDKIQNQKQDKVQDKNQEQNKMQDEVKAENKDETRDAIQDAIKDEKVKSSKKRKPRKKRNLNTSFIMTPEEEAKKKAAEEQAKKIEEEYAKKSDEEIQKEAEDAIANLIKLAVEESDYYGSSVLKLRKDGQVEIMRTANRKKFKWNDKDKGKCTKNERLFDRDGYPVDSVEEALDRYYEKFPEEIENRKKAEKKMASRRDPDTIVNMCQTSDDAKTSETDKDKTSTASTSETDKDKTSAESASETDKDKANTASHPESEDIKNKTDQKCESDSASASTKDTSQAASETTQSTKKKRSKTKSKNKYKDEEDTKKKVSYSFLTELRDYAMEERRKRLMEKYPVKKVYEDKDIEFFEVPKEIYANPKADTCELEEIVCVRLYDDPYIEMTVDFNLDAKVKKPRKKSSII